MSHTRRRSGHGVATLVVVAALGACGGEEAPPPDATAIQLDAQVRQVREAAEAGDVRGARDRLAELGVTVDGLQASGEISEALAQRIDGAADDVDRNLDLLAPTTAPAPPPVDAVDGDDDGEADDGGQSGDDDEDDNGPEDDDDEGDRKPSSKNDKGRGRGRN